MAAASNNYNTLIKKLDQFIRKFYLNQLIRGAMYFVALCVALFVAINLLEHYFYFDKPARKGIFYSFLGVSALSFVYWVAIPLMHYFNLGKVISHEKAASIVGTHFTDVKDKLLNVLQLKRQADSTPNADLLLASINQKTENIKLVPFKQAINLGQNKKYLKYTVPPLLLLLMILFIDASVIKDSTNRLYNNDKEFERAAPFHFTLNQQDLTVVQFEDYILKVKVDGEVLPNEVFIDIDNYHYRLNKDSANVFSYRFSNVQKETDFKIFSTGVESQDYKLNVLKKPNILGFEVELDFPGYTGRKDEKVDNIGDVVVPIGTNINWVFNSQNTDEVGIKFSSNPKLKVATRFSDELFTYKKRAMREEGYTLYVSNDNLPMADSVAFAISVIPDVHPNISVETFADSTDAKLVFFVGDASDDYGLKNLSFNYRISNSKSQGTLVNNPIATDGAKNTSFDYTFDMMDLELNPGDEVSYYFEVWDNDAVNGSKSAKTNVMKFEVPTLDELEEQEEKNNEEIKDKLEESIKESQDIKKDMKELREKMLQEKEMDWQARKELEKLLDRQKELENQINDAKKDFEENMKNQEEFSQPDEDILEKQEKIQDMFEELMDEEMQELMKQIEEMLQELEKDEALEMMEEMEMSDEDMEMELDKMLELFKQLEVEKEMMDQIEKLEELAKEEEQLAEDSEKGEKSKEELEQKQEEIQEKFDDIMEKQEEIEKKNEELESPMNVQDKSEEAEEINEDMEESKDELKKNSKSGASKKQKSAAEKMKKMASDMAMEMEAGEQEQMEEDMEALRQLLENLVTLSFDQEDLMEHVKQTDINTPRYVDLTQTQYKLKDDFKLVEDSLHALSKRVFQIESFVTEKVGEINDNMESSLENLEERKKPQASENQQFSMKNLNDLALMLNEVMQQMQQQMGESMPGNQSCNKPGGSNPKPGGKPGDKMSEGQKGLGEQMKKMKEGLEKGQGGSSKEFAEMAAKQAAMRKKLQEMQKGKQEQGKGDPLLQQAIDEMNKIETDLVNKKLTNEMMKRQEEIMTRLLKSEQAERQREYDNKRKAEVAQEKERQMPPSLEEYIKKREAEIEMFKTVSPALRPYYKQLVEEYFNSLKKTGK